MYAAFRLSKGNFYRRSGGKRKKGLGCKQHFLKGVPSIKTRGEVSKFTEEFWGIREVIEKKRRNYFGAS